MYSFIARQPIFDASLNTVAYELLYRDGLTNAFPAVTPEFATSQLLADHFLVTPLQRLSGKHTSFINFPYEMIVNGLAQSLPRQNVVIEILENSVPDNALFTTVRDMYEEGYCFALDDFTLESEWSRFLPYISVIKFDIQSTSVEQIKAFLKAHPNLRCKLLAEKVERREEFDQYLQLGFHLFQGYFYSKPELIKTKKLPEQKVFILELIREVNAARPDMAKIEKLISRDVAITYKLMRYVNNIKYQHNYHANAESLPFRSIFAFLGLYELKRFITILAVTHISDTSVSELYNVSLVYGRFCELAAHRIGGVSEDDAFIAGLFSRLDAIMDIPMDALLEQIYVSKEVKKALLNREGVPGALVRLCEAFECADWPQVVSVAHELDLTERDIIDMTHEAVKWGDTII